MRFTKESKKLKGDWVYLGSGIFESKYGDRIHSAGMALMASGDKFSLNRLSSLIALSECIRVTGGSKRRGLMLFTELATPSEIARIKS